MLDNVSQSLPEVVGDVAAKNRQLIDEYERLQDELNNNRVMCSVTSVCLSVCVCPVCALAFEGLDLETPFLVCKFRYIFKYLHQSHIIRSSVQVKVTEPKAGLCALFMGTICANVVNI